MQPSVALCMIVRDEQATLARCLESVASAVDTIYITDTGSSDNTLAIAQKFGAHLRSFTWNDDFSAARNHSIQDIREDWLLILDADDCFPAGEALRLRNALSSTKALALTLDYAVMEGYTPAATRRVLKNHRGLRFEGIIHESVRASLPQPSEDHTQRTNIRLLHLGYSSSVIPRKLRRNLPLLEREWDRCRDGADACQRLHVGKELAQTRLQLGEVAAGESLLQTLLADWPQGTEENELATEALATLLWRYSESGQDEAAWQMCEATAPRLNHQPAYPLYRGLVAFRVRRFREALESLLAFERSWLAKRIRIPVPVAYTGLALWDLQGQSYLQLGNAAEAARLFHRCLEAGGDPKDYELKLHLARKLSAA